MASIQQIIRGPGRMSTVKGPSLCSPWTCSPESICRSALFAYLLLKVSIFPFLGSQLMPLCLTYVLAKICTPIW